MVDLTDEIERASRYYTAAMQREIANYQRLRNSIWFGVKINGIILLLIMCATGIHAAIYWLGIQR